MKGIQIKGLLLEFITIETRFFMLKCWKLNLLKMLDKMINHFQRNKNKSLITRIYGLFTIKSNVFVDLDVIIM